jgi:hypothetical protein
VRAQMLWWAGWPGGRTRALMRDLFYLFILCVCVPVLCREINEVMSTSPSASDETTRLWAPPKPPRAMSQVHYYFYLFFNIHLDSKP